uniref:AtpZ/AtpI family protein n=1 Tax=Fundidesulfovibrio putealis TaxID=270496 RepID=A0A7C4AGW5_9BACT
MILKNRNKGTWDGLEKAALMGTNFVAHTFVGLAIGYYFDKWLNTAPWGLIVWLLLGIVAGFRNMYQEAMKLNKTQSLDTGARQEPGDKPADGGDKPDA